MFLNDINVSTAISNDIAVEAIFDTTQWWDGCRRTTIRDAKPVDIDQLFMYLNLKYDLLITRLNSSSVVQ